MNLNDKKTLSNGYKIPVLGYGTRKAKKTEALNGVLRALKHGYRHIDTAKIYENEKEVGEAIEKSGIAREEIFLTTKLRNEDRGYESALAAFEKSLERLKTDYVDLYLIHRPANKKTYENPVEVNRKTREAMIEIYKSGRARAIGVSNFLIHHLEDLKDYEITPMVNQIEFHPGHAPSDLLEYCKKHDMAVEGYSPLGSGKILGNEEILKLAKKYGKSEAQLLLRFSIQNGVIPLPKSVNETRIIENTKIFDFEIEKEDNEKLLNMEFFGGLGHDPDETDF